MVRLDQAVNKEAQNYLGVGPEMVAQQVEVSGDVHRTTWDWPAVGQGLHPSRPYLSPSPATAVVHGCPLGAHVIVVNACSLSSRGLHP